ncbi:MAG: hypothetical protein WCE64_08215, partial [Bacteroidales bacterium]
TKRLSNISNNYEPSKDANKCIIIGKVDILSKGALGIPKKWMELKKVGGESIQDFPLGEFFFVSLEPGDYVIEKTWMAFGLLGAMGYGYPADVNVSFKATPNDIVYIGNLKVTHKFSSLGQLELTGFDKEITNDYEAAAKEFKMRYPNIQDEIKNNLMK